MDRGGLRLEAMLAIMDEYGITSREERDYWIELLTRCDEYWTSITGLDDKGKRKKTKLETYQGESGGEDGKQGGNP